MNRTAASITLHVDVFDEQAMWDHARQIGEAQNAFVDEEAVVDMLGTREEPLIGECLRMIFDPGESPPGIQINDSSAEVETPF